MGVAALGVGSLEAVSSGLADVFAAAVVLVLGGDVADAFVQPDLVVVVPDAFELSGEVGGPVERVQVGVFVFDVSEQGLDPGLAGGRGGASEVLGD